MIPVKEAWTIIRSHVAELPHVRLPLSQCYGRILRQVVFAQEDSPPSDISTMDGYALRTEKGRVSYRVIGTVNPGVFFKKKIPKGECVKICTGGWLPDGVDRVVPLEEVQLDGRHIFIQKWSKNLCKRIKGEDIRAGKLLLDQGVLLGPIELASCASQGIEELQVFPSVKIGHIVTGSELVGVRDKPGRGKIRDSNSALIDALAKQYRCSLVFQNRIKDDLGDLTKRIQSRELQKMDVILISGGAGMGDFDFGKKALQKAGFKIRFDSVALKPGKPLVFATRKKQLAFILPGNPLSHFVVFHLFVGRAISLLSGGNVEMEKLEASSLNGIPVKVGDRETYSPARVEEDRFSFRFLRWHTSGDLAGLIGVNSLVKIPAWSNISTGKKLKYEVLLLPGNN